jgi:hypothetical protein
MTFGIYTLASSSDTNSTVVERVVPEHQPREPVYAENQELKIEINYLKNANLELIKKNEGLVEDWNACNQERINAGTGY